MSDTWRSVKVIHYRFGDGFPPELWGRYAWPFIHAATLLTSVDENEAIEFLRLILINLCCQVCYESFNKFLKEYPFDKKYGSLTHYLHFAHNHVNIRKGKSNFPLSQLSQTYSYSAMPPKKWLGYLCHYLSYSARYQLNNQLKTEIQHKVSNQTPVLVEYRNKLPVQQFITFLCDSSFLRSIRDESVVNFRRHLESLKSSEFYSNKHSMHNTPKYFLSQLQDIARRCNLSL